MDIAADGVRSHAVHANRFRELRAGQGPEQRQREAIRVQARRVVLVAGLTVCGERLEQGSARAMLTMSQRQCEQCDAWETRVEKTLMITTSFGRFRRRLPIDGFHRGVRGAPPARRRPAPFFRLLRCPLSGWPYWFHAPHGLRASVQRLCGACRTRAPSLRARTIGPGRAHGWRTSRDVRPSRIAAACRPCTDAAAAR
jgi:hypothetical protein